MANLPHITTGRIARNHLLTRLTLTAAVLLAAVGGSSALAAPAVAESTTDEEGLQAEIVEMNEEYTILRVRMSEPLGPFNDDPDTVYLGHRPKFDVEEDTVSLPENPEEGLANPIAIERLDEKTYRMYFRTADIDFSEAEDEEVTLGLGYFPERTMPTTYYDEAAYPLPEVF